MAVPAIALSIIGYIVKDRLSAQAAAQRTAEEFNYFLQLSEAELTEASFALAREFPNVKYWEWFGVLKNLRDYGYTLPQNGNGNGDDEENGSKAAMYVGLAVAAVLLMLMIGGK